MKNKLTPKRMTIGVSNMRISTVEQMRNMDKNAIERYGIEDKLLMENAGNAVYFVILKHFGDVKNKNFVVFAGPGNNGGDSLVVSRKLYSNGANVKIYMMSAPEKYKGSAKMNYEIVKKIGIEIEQFMGDNAMVRMAVEAADAVIDGILGTGLSRNVEGKYAEAINIINQAAKLVFAVDIPSGIAGNTGKVMGLAVRANYTITFGLPKLGNILYPGYEYCGEIYVSHISFPPENYDKKEVKIEINTPLILPVRRRDGHKGTFGDALFIAGANKYYGAPFFSAMAFLKAGGGYVRLATAKSVVPFIGDEGREIVYYPLEETEAGSISYSSKEELLKIAEKVDFVVLGPGISLNESTQKLALDIMPKIEKPLLIDGDGLTALSGNITVLDERSYETVLTPHPGEMARLTKKTVAQVLDEPLKTAQTFAEEHNAIVVLKGAHTIIAMPNGMTYINMSGNSGMATAGSGDVLSGTIAAMYGLGLNARESARMGVFVHGLAGDLAAEERGEDGITARDIMNKLPAAVRAIRSNFEAIREKYDIKLI